MEDPQGQTRVHMPWIVSKPLPPCWSSSATCFSLEALIASAMRYVSLHTHQGQRPSSTLTQKNRPSSNQHVFDMLMALGIVNSMQLVLSGQNNWEQLSIFKLLRTSELKAGRTVCWSFLSQPAVALLHQLLIVKAHRQAMAIQHFTQYTHCTNCEHARASIARTPWIHSRTFHKFHNICHQ